MNWKEFEELVSKATAKLALEGEKPSLKESRARIGVVNPDSESRIQKLTKYLDILCPSAPANPLFTDVYMIKDLLALLEVKGKHQNL